MNMRELNSKILDTLPIIGNIRLSAKLSRSLSQLDPSFGSNNSVHNPEKIWSMNIRKLTNKALDTLPIIGNIRLSRNLRHLKRSFASIQFADEPELLVQTTPILEKNNQNIKLIPAHSSEYYYNPTLVEFDSDILVGVRKSTHTLKHDREGYVLPYAHASGSKISGLLFSSLVMYRLKNGVLDFTGEVDHSLLLNTVGLCENGIEDVRLFKWNSRLFGIGGAHSKSNQTTTQVLMRIEGLKVVEYWPLKSPYKNKVEKIGHHLSLTVNFFSFIQCIH